MIILDFDSFSQQEIQINDKTFSIIRKFESRKNNVYLIQDNDDQVPTRFVFKEFSNEFKKNLKIERDILIKLNELKIPTPKILNYTEEYLLLEYIEGQTIIDIVNNNLSNGQILYITDLSKLFEMLGAWFANLHSKTFNKEYSVILKGDCVLKNFIYNPKSISTNLIGLDFEESHYGSGSVDLGAVCSTVLTLKPRFSKLNYKLCKIFINSYNNSLVQYSKINNNNNKNEILKIEFNSQSLAFSTADALEFASKWVSDSSSVEYLTWSKKIRENGSLENNINYI
jgi:tRNA A-37 threonylcarbamoyl transferase component Bud32